MTGIKGSTAAYLADLERIQKQMDLVQSQVSSGKRVARPSDDPDAVSAILKTQSQIAGNSQLQKNLNEVKTELDTGDSVMQQAIKSLQQAISLVTQASSTLSVSENAKLLEQAQDVETQLVGISRTVVNGRFIFSGDQAGVPMYEADDSQANGVKQLTTGTSTRVITDSGGGTLWLARTAQEIFDARESDGSAAEGNVFAAVGSLIAALKSNDSSALKGVRDSLRTADDYLNQQAGLYGIAQTRVADALNTAADRMVTSKQTLSTLRDTDVAGAAIELSQLNIQEQAALSARAKVPPRSLFDYLA